MRWQRQHWSTEDFDFAEDAKQWADPKMFTDDERRLPRVRLLGVLPGRGAGHLELLPFALAAPTHEAKVFLTTQISDEAKHTVFWNGFYREVFGIEAGGLGEMIDKQRYVVNKDWETLFNGILHECAEDLRKDPSDFPKLVRGVTVYMIVIEGMLALSAARFMIKSLRERGWFPGFTAGFTAVNRDESRHVGFGVKFLADAIKDDQGEREDHRGHAEGVPAGRHPGLRPAVGGGPVQLRDALLPLVRDLRVRGEVALEEAGGDGPRSGDARVSRVEWKPQPQSSAGAPPPAPASGSWTRPSRC